MRLLVAEDDVSLAKFLRKGLETENYAVDWAGDGEEAEHLAEQYDFDLVLLDVNLPRRNGFEVLSRLRKKKPTLPVLLLTAQGRIEDRVRGLDLGADDYIVKPFSFTELCARIRALLRRGQRPAESVLKLDTLEVNRIEHSVKRAGKQVELTPKEFALLEYLMLNQSRRVTRAMIIEHVWNLSFDSATNVVDVYINYLRAKIDEGHQPKLIRTVRGVGYQMGPTPGGSDNAEAATAAGAEVE
ncbi:MAG TPA: response regulator transcription factor [Terriglobales bacterium]|nr:response regulator transcription factor [Terriglobales bacterium]